MNPAAAYDGIVVVKDSRLARGDGALRLLEFDRDHARLAARAHFGPSRLELVADLHLHAPWFKEVRDRDPIQTAHGEPCLEQLFIRADEYFL